MLLIQASLIVWSPVQSAQKVCCSLLSHPFCTELFGGYEVFNCWDRASLLYYYNSLWDITVMPTTEISLINNTSFYSWLPQPTSWERLPCSEISFSRTRRATHYIRTLQSPWTCETSSHCKGNIKYVATDCTQFRIRFCNFYIIFTSQISTSSCVGHRQVSYSVVQQSQNIAADLCFSAFENSSACLPWSTLTGWNLLQNRDTKQAVIVFVGFQFDFHFKAGWVKWSGARFGAFPRWFCTD